MIRLASIFMALCCLTGAARAAQLSGGDGWLDKTGMTATSDWAPTLAPMLLDGQTPSDDSGAWNAGWIPGSTFPIEATVDMQRPYSLTAVRYFEGNGMGAAPPVFSLSTDGVTFTPVTPLTQGYNAWNTWNATTFAATTARYVRITIQAAADNVDIEELDMFSPVTPIPDNPNGPTANNAITPYTGKFAYGSNMGYYGWNNNDQAVAGLQVGDPTLNYPGVGVKSLRPGFYDAFIEGYGADVRTDAFAYYQQIGARDLTLFLNIAGGVQGSREDPNHYDGCAQQSQFEANLYQPIWATDAQGKLTANPNNYLAAYVATVVSTYKQYGVRFYEVWNEPDFTYDYDAAWNTSSPNFWGAVNPNPCSLPNTDAPISHHVRMHRVIYEVVHTYDPTAYVATGGLGYPSFLSALLRNTDNPGTQYQQNPGEGDGGPEGTVSARYPLTGGAYFDVLSFHSYPQYDLNSWVADTGICPPGQTKRGPTGNMRCYNEHSDAAAQDYLARLSAFTTLLQTAGYDGTHYPTKIVINTETNVPRVPAAYAISATQLGPIQQWGSEPYADNYIIKTLVLAQANAVRQLYIFGPSDEALPNGTDCNGNLIGTDNNKMEGLFEDFNCFPQSAEISTSQGIAYKSASNFLYGYSFDATLTAQLQLPLTTNGAAFTKGTQHRYVLWAVTTTDRQENTTAAYSFPQSLGLTTLTEYRWNYSATGGHKRVSATGLTLLAAPMFFK